MEIGPIASPVALDTLDALAAVAETPDTGEASGTAPIPGAETGEPTATPLSTGADLGERMLSQAQPHAAAEPAHVPAAAADPGAETGTAQSFARPQPQADATPGKADTALPSASHALSEFAVPASQLVPATLIGLQVEPAWIWTLLQPTTPLPAARPAIEDDEDEDPARHTPHEDPSAQPESHDEAPDSEPTTTESDALIDPALADEGCDGLTRVLQAALAAATPPSALRAAADQWQRGRCVVLACPQSATPDGPAWAFVLWPRRSPARGLPRTAVLTLWGRRVEAHLQWTVTPHGERWCHVRLVKEHHPRHGRQLLPMDAQLPTVPCEVQLGPVLIEHRRPCEARLRIHAVRRFWAALGDQWSVHLVVCSLPLAGIHPLVESVSC
jgi:hypothetical protein